MSQGGGVGQKMPILISKKTTKRGGGIKSLILRRHSLWTAPRHKLLNWHYLHFPKVLICINITPFVIGQMFIVISKRNLIYLLHLPSGPKTVLICILIPSRQLRLIRKSKNWNNLKTRNINCVVFYPWCFYFNSLSTITLYGQDAKSG